MASPRSIVLSLLSIRSCFFNRSHRSPERLPACNPAQLSSSGRASSRRRHSHNYLALTIPGRAASAVAFLSWPARSTWLAPPLTRNATVDKDTADIKGLPSTRAQTRARARVRLTRLPRIWLMAALSFRVHSATTLALISFIYSMKAFRGFLI